MTEASLFREGESLPTAGSTPEPVFRFERRLQEEG